MNPNESHREEPTESEKQFKEKRNEIARIIFLTMPKTVIDDAARKEILGRVDILFTELFILNRPAADKTLHSLVNTSGIERLCTAFIIEHIKTRYTQGNYR